MVKNEQRMNKALSEKELNFNYLPAKRQRENELQKKNARAHAR